MAKPSDVLKSLEKMAKKEFVPSIGPVKGRIITEIIRNIIQKTFSRLALCMVTLLY
jgi:hypothetical protein